MSLFSVFFTLWGKYSPNITDIIISQFVKYSKGQSTENNHITKRQSHDVLDQDQTGLLRGLP